MYQDLGLEVDGTEESLRKDLVSTSMQLGYMAVATNNVRGGTLTDLDCSKLKPLNLSSVLSSTPGMAESVKFHQKLVGVPAGQSFRQYNRITVIVDDMVQAGALNLSNSVLRTYDIVAVRPMNQKVFNQVCTNSEVDLISVDLTQRLPFRMKAAMVKAAIERGVFFEISYGCALLDPKARRELFANCQVLQALTKGHGIIVSSGARQAMELRGPNDVTNMATLFGLSVEVSKAAISKNCESVIMHGVARKKTFKGAVLIERMPVKPDEAVFHVPGSWDPLSVGTTNGASVDLSPLLVAASKQNIVPSSRESAKDLPLTKDLSMKAGKSKNLELTALGGKDDTFISMVTTSSEWTEVGKRKKQKGKHSKGGAVGAQKGAQNNLDSKKRKFS